MSCLQMPRIKKTQNVYNFCFHGNRTKKPNDRKYLPFILLRPNMHGWQNLRDYMYSWFQRRCFKVFPHFKSIEAYDSKASIDTRSIDGRIYVGDHKVRKRTKIRNRYIQAPHLTQDTNGKVTTSQLDITNESQEVSPFPAGDRKVSCKF